MMTPRFSLAVAVAAGALILPIGASIAAGPEETPPDTSVAITQASEVDSPLSVAELADVAVILDAAHADPKYGGEWLDEDGHALTVYVSGAPTEKLALAIKNAEHIKVGLETSPYTNAELTEAALSLAKADQRVQRVSIDPRGAGLSVAILATNGAEKSTAVAVLSKTVAAKYVTTWTATPTPAADAADSRDSDTSPFAGGARVSAGSEGCSTGLPVKKDGVERLLIARHCTGGTAGVQWKSYGSGAVVGKTTGANSVVWDSQLIGNKDYEPKMFSGGWHSSTKRDIARVRPSTIAIGTTINVSGGFSGGGSGKIMGTDVISYSGANHGPLYRIENSSGEPVGGNGDSGSPAVSNWDGFSEPAGIYVARSTASGDIKPCNGSPSTSTRKCATVGWVSPWHSIRDAMGVTINFNVDVGLA